MFLVGLTASLFALLGEVRQVLFYKECEIKAVMKRKDSIRNYVAVYLIREKLQLHQTSVNIL